ncbi:OmpA family protein [Echinicola jeungdonensis]|uniref:OmpA family protein n=1 Tax=Echinicola jeungdonensis TaxID=709343 RepID=A0ABV5J4K9_9BACT|nr:OmpA family protein [Echinicola jeungdonensis]MDN3668739.1 OmpA family protein [Echinicola jeungdonensis]
MKNRFLLPVFLVFLFLAACKSLQQKGAEQFKTGEYQLAIGTFSRILENNPENTEANFYIAESYRLSNRIEDALPYYNKLLEEEGSFENYFKKAKSLHDRGEYEEAVETYTKAKEQTNSDSLMNLAEMGIKNINKLEEIENYWPYHEIQNYQLLNTGGIDYAPVVSENFLYFTSSRGAGGVYPATGQGYTKLYRTRADGIKVDVQGIQPLPEFRNEEGLNQGAIAISPDGNTIIYARGNSTSKNDLPEVNLFASYFKGTTFTDPIWMPVNEEETYWNSTPAFSPDGQVLYFSSNRPGGYGGTDLYKATKLANGDFGNAQNLGPEINTPGNEMFPRPVSSDEFFFSSDGHPGFGKLDIFVAKTEDGKTTVKNLGKNINSTADDFGIYFTNYPKEGFISSNREGGVGDDDIYYFEDKTPKPKLVNVFLKVTTLQKTGEDTEEVLPQTRVAVYDSTRTMVGGDFSNSQGELRFKLQPNSVYSIVASKNGYFTKSINYSTKGKTPPKEELVQDITNVSLDTTLVLDKLELEKAIVLENIYYDLDKANIRPDAAKELDKLVKILKDNPEIRIELSSHTDDRASDAYNDDLSQRRAESAVNYIVSQGIDKDRLVAKGYGKRQLLIENAQTEEEHQTNRRTEFKVIEIEE